MKNSIWFLFYVRYVTIPIHTSLYAGDLHHSSGPAPLRKDCEKGIFGVQQISNLSKFLLTGG